MSSKNSLIIHDLTRVAMNSMHQLAALFAASALFFPSLAKADDFKVTTFRADVTIPLGHRCMGVLPTKSKQIDDPLELTGVVIIGNDKPVVLASIDWCEIRNGAYDQWRESLATAVGTERSRVLLSSIHQHDAPVTDREAQQLLDSVGMEGELYDVAFHADCIKQTCLAAKKAMQSAEPLTHISLGEARVENIASNRRVEYPDGSVRYDRYSRSGTASPQAQLDDGMIDPMLKSITFFNGDRAVATISHYATHPMSYYGQGGVSADFVGLARRRRQIDTPETLQIYFSGCSGDVTAGKYNNGTPASRAALTERLYTAMRTAKQRAEKHTVAGVSFCSTPLNLPFHESDAFSIGSLEKELHDSEASEKDRILAAMGLSSRQRLERGQAIDLPCIDFGVTQIVLLPGEAFVGYQLMAQEIRDDSFVMAIGYGECWPGYIPTKQAFDENFGHDWRWVGPGCEQIMRAALTKVLRPDGK